MRKNIGFDISHTSLRRGMVPKIIIIIIISYIDECNSCKVILPTKFTYLTIFRLKVLLLFISSSGNSLDIETLWNHTLSKILQLHFIENPISCAFLFAILPPVGPVSWGVDYIVSWFWWWATSEEAKYVYAFLSFSTSTDESISYVT